MKRLYTLLIVMVLLVSMGTSAFAADKFGTKAYGMGGAFTAIADDASAIYWNPAGLTQTKLLGVEASLGGKFNMKDIDKLKKVINDIRELASDELSEQEKIDKLNNLTLPDSISLNLDGLGAVNLGRFAVGLVANNQFSFEDNGDQNIDSDSNDTTVPTFTATNQIIGQGILGYGKELIDPPLIGSLSYGVGAKYINVETDTAVSQVVDNELKLESYPTVTNNGFALDLGALATVSDIDILNVKAGASLKNLVASKNVQDDLEQTTTLGVGVTFKFPLVKLFSARVAADLKMPEVGENIQHVGAEANLGIFSLRAGAYGEDLGNKDVRIITGGVGLDLPLIDFNAVMDSNNYYSLSGSFNF